MKLEIQFGPIFFSIKPARECLFSRRLGYSGIIIKNHSVLFELVPMSWLMTVNVFFFQWFCIRLTKHCERLIFPKDEIIYITGVSYSARDIDLEFVVKQYYSIQGFILPCTGWWSNYIYMTKKPFFIRITKKFISKK